MQQVPAYTVRPLEGQTFVRQVCEYVKGKGFTYDDVEEEAGFMVHFPKRHSIHVRTRDELKRMGFDKEAPVQMEEDDD